MQIERTDFFCFFYKPEVPDLGPEFTYVKLGRREPLAGGRGQRVVFEADLPDNLAGANPWLWDYSGLYLLYRNGLCRAGNVCVLHYDAKLSPDWRQRFEAFDRPLGVIDDLTLRQWIGFNKPVNVLPFCEIEEVFGAARGQGFWAYVREHGLSRVAGFSQFAATAEVWREMMEFLLPLIQAVKDRRPAVTYYAHLLEICWGAFCAAKGYATFDFCRSTVSSSHLYGQDVALDAGRVRQLYDEVLAGRLTAREAYGLAGVDFERLEAEAWPRGRAKEGRVA